MSTREPELYKDKIEVSLDGRQIFYLFFGGAVIVGIVFVLGVMVGRRVEARGHLDPAQTQATTDPLAALDRLEGSGGLSFHGALTGNGKPTDVENTINDLEKARKPEIAKPPHVADKPVTDKPKQEAVTHPDKVIKQDAVADKPKAADKAADKVIDKPGDKADKADKADKTDKTDRTGDKPKVEKKKHDDDGVTGQAEPKPEADRKPDAAKAEEARARFTLQLSSFQDKTEAETFLSSIKAAGYQATVTEAEVTGKTYYRVRLGTYRSIDAANDAKADFERAVKKTAQVMKL